jgi:hypothetical protein
MGVPPLHDIEQLPHVATFERSVSQPSAALPLQLPHPAAHADTAKVHEPAPHVAVPLTCGRPLQLAPHSPQLFAFVCSSTHAPLQSVYPVLHVNPHAPAVHAACAWATAVAHALPHAPQLLALLVVLTHVVPQSVGVAAGHPDAHA